MESIAFLIFAVFQNSYTFQQAQQVTVVVVCIVRKNSLQLKLTCSLTIFNRFNEFRRRWAFLLENCFFSTDSGPYYVKPDLKLRNKTLFGL